MSVLNGPTRFYLELLTDAISHKSPFKIPNARTSQTLFYASGKNSLITSDLLLTGTESIPRSKSVTCKGQVSTNIAIHNCLTYRSIWTGSLFSDQPDTTLLWTNISHPRTGWPSHSCLTQLVHVFHWAVQSHTDGKCVKMCGRGAVLFALTDNVNENHERAARVKFLRCVVVGNTPDCRAPLSDTGNKFRYRRTSNAKPCCANTNRVCDPVA